MLCVWLFPLLKAICENSTTLESKTDWDIYAMMLVKTSANKHFQKLMILIGCKVVLEYNYAWYYTFDINRKNSVSHTPRTSWGSHTFKCNLAH